MSRPHPLYGHPDVREVGVPVATMWTAPDAPRPGVDDAAVADVPDLTAWTAALDAEGGPERRLGLHGRTLTQLLLGEAVRVLDQDGAWSRVAALSQPSAGHRDGYPGWVRTAHLATPVDRWTGPSVHVTAASATCAVGDGTTMTVSCGTGLWLDDAAASASTAPTAEDQVPAAEDPVPVLLPGGRTGALPRAAVRLSDKDTPPDYSPEDLLATARQFVGLRYLWGGTSAAGLDCSGLVHLTFRTHRRLVPRDASDQAGSPTLEPVDLDDVRPGDLYFFARPGERVYHVGFATRPVDGDGRRWMLHAPEGGGLIEDAVMEADRAEKLVSAGRVRPRPRRC